MRIAVALALVFASISQGAVADVKRYKSVPQPLWGKWAPSQDACKNADPSVFLVSVGNVSISNQDCIVDSVSETPSAAGPKYSALLRCPKQGANTSFAEQVLILWPKTSGKMSAGSTFSDLKDYQLCSEGR